MAGHKNVQFHIEIQESHPGNSQGEGEVMVVLDLNGHDLPDNVAQTIWQLAQSGAHSGNYQDILQGRNAVLTEQRQLSVIGDQVSLAGNFSSTQTTTCEENVYALTAEQSMTMNSFERETQLDGDPEEARTEVVIQRVNLNTEYGDATNTKSPNTEAILYSVGDGPAANYHVIDTTPTTSYVKSELPDETVVDEADLVEPSVFECDLCDFSSKSEVELGNHCKSVHELKKPYKCFRCNKTFEKELSLHIHSMTHGNLSASKRQGKTSLYRCPLCKYQCRLNKMLVSHFEEEHSNVESPRKLYSCAFCKFTCLSEAEFDAHALTPNHIKNQSRLEVCPVCSQAVCYLKKHMRVAHNQEKIIVCNVCGYRAKKESVLRTHMLTHSDQRDHICPICSGAFKSDYRLKKHMKIHNPTKDFLCAQCGFSTTVKYELKRHIQRVHNKKTVFTCKVCQQSFQKVLDLKYHAMSEHGSRDKYYCEHCDFSCVEINELWAHKRQHPDLFHRYFCSSCDFSTPYKFRFKTHQKTHLGAAHKSYVCHICGHSCWEKGNLEKHMKVHSTEKPFSCNFCSYTCKLESTLKSHHRHVHSDLKPFKCHFCTYSGKTSHGLKQHMMIHDGIKPFQCPLCPHACRERSKLRRHLARKHKQDPISKMPFGTPEKQEIRVFQVYTSENSKTVSVEIDDTAESLY